MSTALITGVSGQDGSYLAELLLARGYAVHGIVRRSSSINTARIDHLLHEVQDCESRFFLHYGDVTDASRLTNLIHRIQPDEIYNLAAQSHVRVSFDIPDYTVEVAALGTVRLLEAIRESGVPCKLYQASSSEMFGAAPPPQSETTPFQPQSPYAVGKLAAYWMVRNYREAYGMFACNGILLNHESSRRGETFVTRKITRAVAEIAAGHKDALYLGNLDARRDWGYAPEYVEAMWMMLQQPAADDYVISTGEMHSVREFVELAFALVERDWQQYVRIDPRYYRPLEVEQLCGDSTKAMAVLGWKPKVTFDQLVRIMLAEDLRRLHVPVRFSNKLDNA